MIIYQVYRSNETEDRRIGAYLSKEAAEQMIEKLSTVFRKKTVYYIEELQVEDDNDGVSYLG